MSQRRDGGSSLTVHSPEFVRSRCRDCPATTHPWQFLQNEPALDSHHHHLRILRNQRSQVFPLDVPYHRLTAIAHMNVLNGGLLPSILPELLQSQQTLLKDRQACDHMSRLISVSGVHAPWARPMGLHSHMAGSSLKGVYPCRHGSHTIVIDALYET